MYMISPRTRRHASAFLATLMLGASLPLAHAREVLMPPAEMERQVLEPMERGFTLYRQAARSVPRAAFDPHAKMDALENTPMAAYAWVRDHTDLLPYPGNLRGPRGTLMEQSGNSLDRVLLLDAMLEHIGIENRRVVHLRLDEATARALLAHWADHSAHTHPADAAAEEFDLEGTIMQVAEDTGEDPEVLRRDMQDALVQSELLRAELATSVQLQSDMLREALPMNPEAERADPSAHFRDHWYLEAEIDGEWLALDPARRDHAPGQTLTGERVDRHAPGEIPQAWRHRVEITVIAEQWEGGELRERPVLAHEISATDLQDPHFSIQLLPPRENPLENLLTKELSRGEILENISRVNEWVPVLKVDGESIIQFSVMANGDVNENPEAPPQVRAVADAVGMLSGLGRRREAEATKELTALRLDITLHAPGREPETLSRFFSDILGPAVRESGAATWEPNERARRERALGNLGGITVTPVTHTPHEDWVNLQTFRSMLENRDALLQVISGGLQGNMADVERGFTGLQRHPVDLYQIAAARGRLHPQGHVTHADGINLLARAETLHLNSAGDDFLPVRMYDWIRNATKARPGVDSPQHAVFIQGIVDTHVEELLTRNDPAPDHPRINTARQYGEDLLTGMDWVRVTQAEELGPVADNFTHDELARFRHALAEGHHLLIRPEVLTPFEDDLRAPLWWTFNPETGSLLGHGLDGRGVSTEYAIKMATIVFTLIDALIGVVLCMDQEGWALVCCLAEVAVRSGAGIGLGFGIASRVSAVTAYYIGVGFSAASAATGGVSILRCP